MNVYTWKLSGGRNGTLPSSILGVQNLLENQSGFLDLVLPLVLMQVFLKTKPG